MDTLKKLEKNGIFLKYADIVKICEKYNISELSIFGSSIRDDFTDKSDVDLLILYESYLPESGISLFTEMEMENEFSELIKREVDIVDKEGLKNPIRKRHILSSCEIVYETK